MAGPSPHDRLIRKLESISTLTSEEAAALRGLPMTLKRLDDDADIVCIGDRPSHCCLLVDGFLFRYITLPTGARQITSLHVPGDMPDLQSLHLEVMDHSLGALAPSTVAFIPHAAVHDLVKRYTGIASALWRDTLVDAAIFREWIANVGQRSAYQRAAHLMCEFVYKMRAVGLANEDGCPFPLTQQEMGNSMGLSVVHVNRTLQALRADGLIVLKAKHLKIPDWEAFKKVAGFDPTYLHLSRRAAA